MGAALLADSSATFPILPSLVFIPLLGALIVALLPYGRVSYHKMAAFLFSGAAGAVSVWMMADFDKDAGGEGLAGFQFVSDRVWIEDLGISWLAGVDGISLFLVVLTGLLFPLAMLAVEPEHSPRPYYAWLLLLQAGCMGVFIALDLFMFFVFFEIVLVPMYFLIAQWGHGNARYAATKFFLYTMLGRRSCWLASSRWSRCTPPTPAATSRSTSLRSPRTKACSPPPPPAGCS